MIDLHLPVHELLDHVAHYRHLSPPFSRKTAYRWARDAGLPDGPDAEAAAAAKANAWLVNPPIEVNEAVRRDRSLGAFLGLAIGDAVGTTLEFQRRDSAHVGDMVGGGPFRLQPGEWTDDTSMALCLADSLVENAGLDVRDFAMRLSRWYAKGENSVTGHCFDIGNTTRTALEGWMREGNFIGNGDETSNGNGALIRQAPLSIFQRHSLELSWLTAKSQSGATHNAIEGQSSCQLLSVVLYYALNGASLEDALAPKILSLTPRNVIINAGEYKRKSRDQIRSSGYVIDTLEAALWSVFSTRTFEDAVLLAANLADDADSVAATTGQIAGALYGLSGIPARWRATVAWSDRILDLASRLHAMAPARRA